MATINVDGMSCGHCVKSVQEALEKIDGITNVKVDLLAKTASYDEEKPVDREVAIEAIKKIGFGAA